MEVSLDLNPTPFKTRSRVNWVAERVRSWEGLAWAVVNASGLGGPELAFLCHQSKVAKLLGTRHLVLNHPNPGDTVLSYIVPETR